MKIEHNINEENNINNTAKKEQLIIEAHQIEYDYCVVGESISSAIRIWKELLLSWYSLVLIIILFFDILTFSIVNLPFPSLLSPEILLLSKKCLKTAIW